MITKFKIEQLDELMKIWLETNIDAHSFIPKEYWIDKAPLVKKLLPSSDIYVFKECNTIKGFIGVIENGYIAGIFIKKEYQREGIGNKLIDYIKSKYENITLDVYNKNEKALNFYYKNNFKVLDSKFDEETKELEYTLFYKK
ncbi:N-acetyltransferase [Clostridium ihumii]|uniref:N-acetyltransferase n=1 Tax=Clostridium ihumii TaxID=1470356 RepID=UPI0005903F38|nr:N-acetyltransferase [Clostridium ihumii]